MEDEKSQQLRKWIKSVQQDASLSAQQRAKRIQFLMRGKSIEQAIEEELKLREVPKPVISNNWPAPSEEELTPLYRDENKQVLGCKHYAVDCKIRAACCGKLFPCRLCHDEAITDHKIDRFATTEMECMHCRTLQPIGQVCNNPSCQQTVSHYYCPSCRFHDNTPGKSIFHCPDCGLCRIGKGLNIDYFHCHTCGHCLAIQLKDNHKCIENNLKSDCPICGTDLFTSRSPVSIMKCGHSMHRKCYKQYLRMGSYSCPLCCKSVADMTSYWQQIDAEIEAQPMPIEFKEALCKSLCNDCGKRSDAPFHFLGMKCADCGSYNTAIVDRHGTWPSFPLRSATNTTDNSNASSATTTDNSNNNNGVDSNPPPANNEIATILEQIARVRQELIDNDDNESAADSEDYDDIDEDEDDDGEAEFSSEEDESTNQ